MIVNNLYIIIDELSKFHRSKEELEAFYISERLEKSLQSYIKELDDSLIPSKGKG